MTSLEELWPLLSCERGVAYFAKSKTRVTGGWMTSLTQSERVLQNLTAHGHDLYLHLNSSTHSPRKVKGASADIVEWRRFLLDADPIQPNADPQNVLQRALALIPGGESCATVINSGRGWQAWIEIRWLPVADGQLRRKIERSTAALLRTLGHAVNTPSCVIDPRVGDLARVGRWPGSVNRKTSYPSRLISIASTQLDPEWVFQFEPTETQEAEPKLTNASQFLEVLPHLTLVAETFILDGVSEPGRHSAAYATGARLRELGVPFETAAHWVCRGADRCSPKLAKNEATRALRKAYNQEAS